MQAHIGDRLIVQGNRVGTGRRFGTVMDVLGDPARPRLRVRWDDNRETVMFPDADTTVERAATPPVAT
jgi:hypothetical protein